MGYRVGVDIGGSFTDFAVFDEADKSLKCLKVFSRPDQPGAEILNGLRRLAEEHGATPDSITYFTHGTTVGINTVIQRKGLQLALFTTRNFSDVLELGRLKCADMYDLLSRRPDPLIPRDRVFGLCGRLGADGSVEDELDQEEVLRATRDAISGGAEGIVVSLLHSYRNPAQELEVKELVRSVAADLPVFCSSETWPIIREYERTITATIGGYVQPRVANYLSSLQRALADAGVPNEPRLTKSNGGVMTAEQGKRDCVQMILSGTAAGVIGASHVARNATIEHCMSLDVGGTSADVAIIIGGEPQYGIGEVIGDFQIFIPSVSVTSIGEGGGSIAWVDALGVLKVGPESAGSKPGPACYGRGGTCATVTDAFAVCGLLEGGGLGYNAVAVDVGKARDAVSQLTGAQRSIEETAEAIIGIAVSGMFTEVSGLVSRFGIDPRQFSLLAFGGAGPMVGCFLARELGMAEVVVPATPGVLSALGGLMADLKNDFIATTYCELTPAQAADLRTSYEALRDRAEIWLRDDQGYTGPVELTYSADMRYRGQSFELETHLQRDWVEELRLEAWADAFHREHRRIYGHSDASAPIQVISVRVVISGLIPKPEVLRLSEVRGVPEARRQGLVRLDGETREAKFYRRSDLLPGHRFPGPAVVFQDDCTSVIPSDFTVRVDEFGNLRAAPVDQNAN